MRFAPVLLGLAAAAACGAPGNPQTFATPSDAGSADSAGDGATLRMGGPDAAGSDGSSPSTPDSGASSESGASDSGASHDSGTDATGGLLPAIPAPTGACPTFTNGDVTFSPAGIPQRHATVYMTDAAMTMHGPLILYWYATGSSTQEAAYSLGATLATIEAAGGIVVAPDADPTAGEFEWFIVNGSPKLDDFQVADEIVGCAAKTTGIDTTHIHSMGMSAGALQTTAVSFMRSAYIASVATYSGGMPPGFMPTIENPANKFAAFIFDGGSTDDIFGVDFQAASQLYLTTLQGTGHFAAICDHGMGHSIPLDAAPSVAMFFQANGFGVSPSPYANGLPAGFPSYCML
jgi:poly(3-hydroxybutyrate) depolymerase